MFALIKSNLPSPFTSAAATECGAAPTTGEEASTKEKLVVQFKKPKELTVRRSTPVTPAPFPASVLLPLVSSVTPLKLFEPRKTWLALSSPTLVESRASAKVPLVILDASRLGIWLV